MNSLILYYYMHYIHVPWMYWPRVWPLVSMLTILCCIPQSSSPVCVNTTYIFIWQGWRRWIFGRDCEEDSRLLPRPRGSTPICGRRNVWVGVFSAVSSLGSILALIIVMFWQFEFESCRQDASAYEISRLFCSMLPCHNYLLYLVSAMSGSTIYE